MNDLEVFQKMQASPTFFVEVMWGLTPERDNAKFVKGKNISHQQHDILLAVEKALKGEAPKRISIASAHGIGKTCTMAWLLLWYLFCFMDCQIACTAPTADQMYDVMWKEVSKWLSAMPKAVQDKYELSTSHVRIKERPDTWFARAKTARKESPEALAGMHADYVMIMVDEASGVPEEIFNTAEGALTNKNTLTILISNPTRLMGYFYASHHQDKANWQTLQFSSIQAPNDIVDSIYNERIREKHGEESDEYKIRVLGQFPREDSMDDKGFVPLFTEDEIKFTKSNQFFGSRLGVDPSGEGQDVTAWVQRDQFKCRVVGKENVSSPMTISEKTLTYMDSLEIPDSEVMIDNFGVGADVAKHMALSAMHPNVGTINVGEKSAYEIFLNLRAEAYSKVKKWFREGGCIVDDQYGALLKKELMTVKFRRNLQGKMMIMSKDEMRRQGIPSPNFADALMLTFVKGNIGDDRRAKQYIPGDLNRDSSMKKFLDGMKTSTELDMEKSKKPRTFNPIYTPGRK